MIIDNYNFDIYLEGYLIPGVIYFTISESSGAVPRAVITITGNSKGLKLLAGTVVQIFGHKIDRVSEKSMLLYEGELTSIAYGYNRDSGDTITLNTHSLLAQFYNTRLRPSDSIVNYHEEAASGTNNSPVLLKSEKFKRYSSSVNKTSSGTKKYIPISLNATSGLKTILSNEALNFSQAMGDESPGKEGNFIPFLKTVNEMFVQSDILYAINARSLNLFDSVFVYPNPDLPYYFHVKVMLEAIKAANSEMSLQMGDDSILSIARFFNGFKQRLYYRSIAPAAPTASNLFYSDVPEYKNSNTEPIREYYVPGIESGPPALPNIIFPEEIININFSRDLYGEVTRVVLQGSIGVTGQSVSKAILPVVVAPDITYIESGEAPNTTIYTAFTDEELYRGVNLQKISIDGILNKILIDELKEPGDTGTDTLKEKEVKEKLESNYGGMSDSLQVTADRHYVVNKFNTRTIQVVTNWDPNYITGLPGMVFMDNMPTFVGTVEQVNHNCSTTGAVTTSVTLANCRIMFDEEKTNTEVPSIINPLSSSLMSEESENAIYGGFKYMFNESLYSFETMGAFLYHYIITGKLNKNVFSFAELTGGDDRWAEFKDIPEIPLSEDRDYSILYYIKNQYGAIKPEVLDKVTDYKNYHNLEEVPDEVKNGIYLKEAIKAFKNIYKNLQNNDSLDTSSEIFRNNVKKRNIISKSDYLKFIGGHNTNNHQQVIESDTKDLSKIVNEVFDGDLGYLKKVLTKVNFPDKLTKADYTKTQDKISSLETSIRKIKKEINKIWGYEVGSGKIPGVTQLIIDGGNAQYAYNLKDELKNKKKLLLNLKNSLKIIGEELENEVVLPENVLSLFRPYNRTRKAHVIEAFKDFISVFDIIVKGN